MRWLAFLPLLAFVVPVQAQDKEAEALFGAMEKKIRSAESLDMTFAAELTKRGTKVGAYKGTVRLAAGNKCRLDLDVDLGKPGKLLMVSDGKSGYAREGDNKPNKQPPPAGWSDRWKGLIARLGMASSIEVFKSQRPVDVPPEKEEPFDIEKKAPVKMFKLGPKEKIGQRDAQVVEYLCEVEKGLPFKMSVHIDVETKLPLKSVLVIEAEGKTIVRIVETYSAFTVNGKIDPEVFALPK